MRLLTLCTIIAIFITSVARAEAPAKPVTHDYDIRRLVVYIPDFTDAPDFSLKPTDVSPTTWPTPKQPTRDEIAAGIVKSVLAMLPDGSAGNVVEEKGILHVTALPADQSRIASAIDHWLAERSIEITVETRILSLNHQDVAALDPAVRSLLDDVSANNAAETIDDKQVNALLHATEAGKNSILITAPRVTLFQNQRAYVLVATQTGFVSGYALDKSTSEKKAYKPVIRVAEDGMVLDVRASAASSGDASAIALDCHDQFSKLHGMRDSTWVDPLTHEKRPIQVPDISKQSIDRLVTILPGRSVLLRVADPSAIGAGLDRNAVKPGQDCIILLKANIVKPTDSKLPTR